MIKQLEASNCPGARETMLDWKLNPEKIRGGWQLTAEQVKVCDGWTNYGHSFWASVLSISWAGNPAL